MTVSALRTIVVGSPAGVYGVSPVSLETLRFPAAEPGENLDYALGLSAVLSDVADVFVGASLEVAPSGPGELAAADLTVANALISFFLSGGVAGRRYVIRIMAMTLTRTFVWMPTLLIDGEATSAPPASTDYGPTITWSAALPLKLTLIRPLSVSLAAAIF